MPEAFFQIHCIVLCIHQCDYQKGFFFKPHNIENYMCIVSTPFNVGDKPLTLKLPGPYVGMGGSLTVTVA